MKAATPSLPPRVGRYDILERLAIGGMAEVFLAVERGPHGLVRLVVVKRILPHLAANPAMVRMFLQEARIAAGISHPNVVQILELGDEDGQPYIAMEYVAGSTFRQLVVAAKESRRIVPIPVVIWLFEQACAGAHAAHELADTTGRPLQLVHRDLSPHNLMVDGAAHVKLLDFGIAKLAEDVDHTRTGVLKGKLRYMSPEQTHQAPLDRRSDVFTLGIVLWEMLAGERLFERATELGTMQAIVTGDLRDLRKVRSGVPEPIVAVVEQALQVDKADRFSTADAMRRGLVDAAAASWLEVTQDGAAVFIDEVLGSVHSARRATVQAAVERVDHRDPDGAEPIDLDPERRPPDGAPPEPTRTVAIPKLLRVNAGTVAVVALGLVSVIAVGVGAVHVATRPSGRPIRIGLLPEVDAAILTTEDEPLRVWLEGKTGHPVQIFVQSTYDATGQALIRGDVDYAMLAPYEYVKTTAADPRVHLVAEQVVAGSSGVDALLLVSEDSPVKTAADLRGKTICYSDPNSTTGWLFPRAWLRAQGVDPDVDLKSHTSGNHLQVLRDLDQGVCDVAGTFSGALTGADEAQIQIRFRQLAIIGRTPNDALCSGASANPEVTEALKRALVGLEPRRDLGLAHIGAVQKITGFVPGSDADFDLVRQAETAP